MKQKEVKSGSRVSYALGNPAVIAATFFVAAYLLLSVWTYFSGGTIKLEFVILMALLTALTWYLMSIDKKTFAKLDEQQKSHDEVIQKCDDIKVDLSIVKSVTSPSVISISNVEDFYAKLKHAESTSTQRIWLMHLDPFPPTSDKLGNAERAQYFDFVNDFALKHEKVEIKRIIGISKNEKLTWVDEQIKKTRNIPNISFAYVRIDDIERCFPMTIISCQIIDTNKLFILNPSKNHVPGTDFQSHKCLYIESTAAVEIYDKHYKKLWEKLSENDCEIGCILKNGADCSGYDEFREAIVENIGRKLCSRHKGVLSPEIDSRMDASSLM